VEDFRIALLQLNLPQANTVHENLAKIAHWVAQAADAGARVAMFGELGVTGYLLDSGGLTEPGVGASMHYRRAEEIPGPATQKLVEIARETGVTIVGGMGDLQAGVVYNAMVVVDPEGYVGKQRKLHMPDPEYRYYGVGSDFRVFDLGFCKLGISICFDNWFPETSRVLALKGAEVLLAPWMWTIPHDAPDDERMRAVEHRRCTHTRMFSARAMDNAMYVLVLDHVGLEAEGFEMPGISMAFDPFGSMIEQSDPFVEQVLLVDLKGSEIEKYRSYGHHYTLKYRRPDIYSELTKMVP
jgi:N-carbamoylputrescine amidase